MCIRDRALARRAELPALHPDADMELLSPDRVDRVVLRRTLDGQSLVAVHNMTASRLTLDPARLGGDPEMDWTDCLSGQVLHPRRLHALEPYAVLWLVQ